MIIGTLLKIEAIKTGKRLAFIISWISMAFLATTIFYEPYAITKRVRGNSSFSFPDAWGILLSEEMMIPMFFGCIAIIIVTTAEFSSRTARQNVIDGLSKEQFFLSKTLLAFLICLLFAGTYLAIGASFAAAVTDFSAIDGPFLPRKSATMLLGLLGTFLGWGAVALFVSLGVRNSGSAMGVWIMYISFIEKFIGFSISNLGGWTDGVVKFLPMRTFNRASNIIEHDPDEYAKAVELASSLDMTPPEIWGFPTMLTAWSLWMVVLIGGSYMWFKKRDL